MMAGGHHYLGLPWDFWVALLAGIVSSSTLPIGALIGIMVPDCSDRFVGMVLGFGVGSLIFAVTVELYGEAATELEFDSTLHALLRIIAMMGGAIVGSLLYIMSARWLDKAIELEEDDDDGESVSIVGRLPDFTAIRESQRSGYRATMNPRQRAATAIWTRCAKARPDTESPRTVRGRRRSMLGALDPKLRRRLADPTLERALQIGAAAEARQRRGAVSWNSSASSTSGNGSEEHAGFRTALFIWFGVLLDGIPESILLGFLAAEDKISAVIVVALMISQFPESFSSSAMMAGLGIRTWKIMVMWSAVCVMTGVIAALTALALPAGMLNTDHHEYSPEIWYLQIVGSGIEGIAGGAMLACVVNVMLPDAYKKGGDLTGLILLMGFLVAVLIKVFGSYAAHYYAS